MFIEKQNLINAFKQIRFLYSNNPDELAKQGCTQFFSGLRYFLATSAFEKRQQRNLIDSTNINDKNQFIKYVGEVVSVNKDEYTCNFYDDFKSDDDYKVGSNFYSAGFIDDSRKNPTNIFEYPSRDKDNIILKARDGKFSFTEGSISAFKRKYLANDLHKPALVLWLLRNENLSALTKESVESFLRNQYTENVAQALFLQDYSLLSRISLSNEKASLNSKELFYVNAESTDDSKATIEDRKTDFISWLSQNCRGTAEFQKHMGDVLEKWLDDKISNAHIGNLFRFEKSSDYEEEKKRILELPLWKDVNDGDSNGRPLTALNHYSNYLKNYEQTKGVSTNSKGGEKENGDSLNLKFSPTQIIYYGVPGCGKSFTIDKETENLDESHKIRIVFHPDYCNADFVGQILPVVKLDEVDGKVKESVGYEFIPGPFSRILKKACLHPTEPFALVIEEINRGNAAAIFGDLFQLLDRENGKSKYGIANKDIIKYLESDKDPDEKSQEGSEKFKVTNEEYTASIKLPPNLSIYATMNTSDQNVFTLDNAFQRRWEMKLIQNKCDWENDDHKNQALAEIGDSQIYWEAFRQTVNEAIAGDDSIFNSDDKQLGLFFMKADGEGAEKVINKSKFANKVLKYLWTDVFKRDNREKIFMVKTLSELVNSFDGENKNFSNSFTDIFVKKLKENHDAISKAHPKN